ncbi:MAG: helix-turn-helix transcriptional regulator [Desulfovibrio aminophilus]|uniref:helix-turn-helix transcriptional regulator n=1 Tax=Desulfovibrio aminophilus TaxID=81425 RepID=UPI0039EACEAB
MPTNLPSTGFLRDKQILFFVPVCRATLWAWTKEGRFPKPVKLGPRTTAWRAEDVREWLAARGERQAA